MKYKNIPETGSTNQDLKSFGLDLFTSGLKVTEINNMINFLIRVQARKEKQKKVHFRFIRII